ncbi:MAG: hypothetical protein ACK463_39605, partial [Bradyrhizobium sp.]
MEMLEDLGHRVIGANSGPHALDILRSDQEIDLMMTDHVMAEVLQHLHGRHRDQRIVVDEQDHRRAPDRPRRGRRALRFRRGR